MIIVELCGIPGAGKSSLVERFKKNKPSLPVRLRGELYPASWLVRNIQARAQLAAYRFLGRKPAENAVFDALFKRFPGASPQAKLRLMDLYKRIRALAEEEGILLLEEGPIQYLSSLSYDRPLLDCEELRAYWALYSGFPYHVLYCECGSELAVSRIRNRRKAHGSYDPQSGNIVRLLDIKRGNIRALFSALKLRPETIDMEVPLERSAAFLTEYLEEKVLPSLTGAGKGV